MRQALLAARKSLELHQQQAVQRQQAAAGVPAAAGQQAHGGAAGRTAPAASTALQEAAGRAPAGAAAAAGPAASSEQPSKAGVRFAGQGQGSPTAEDAFAGGAGAAVLQPAAGARVSVDKGETASVQVLRITSMGRLFRWAGWFRRRSTHGVHLHSLGLRSARVSCRAAHMRC